MDPRQLEALLRTVTPERLRQLVEALAAAQAPGQRDHVDLSNIMDALAQGDLGGGAEGWRAQLRLKEAIAQAVAQVPGMRFVEGDS